MSWAAPEFEMSDLSDENLNCRAVPLAVQLAYKSALTVDVFMRMICAYHAREVHAYVSQHHFYP